MFMFAAPPAAEPAAPVQGRNRHGPLLGLVRRIIDYGRDLVTALQRQNTPSTPLARRFGTFNLALIIARIARGLSIAAALETRLSRARPARSVQRTTPNRAPLKPRPARPTPAEEDAALLRALPSAEEIAAHVRNRSAGAVIVEICRDLGINATHPLWNEIRDAIIAYDGSLSRMLKLWLGAASAFLAALPYDPWASLPRAWDGPSLAGTGPP